MCTNKQKNARYIISNVNNRTALLITLFSICTTALAIPHIFLPRSIRIYPRSPHCSPKVNFNNLN